MRRNIEQEAIACDGLVTALSELVLVDNALEYAAQRPQEDDVSLEEQTQHSLAELFASIHSTDITADLLTNTADMLVDQLANKAADIIAQRSIAGFIATRRQEIVERAKEHAKNVGDVQVTPHKRNVVLIGSHLLSEFGQSQHPPIVEADETLHLRPEKHHTILAKKSLGNEKYKGFTGYSLNTYSLKSLGRQARYPYRVSLVDLNGHPQVDIAPLIR